MRSARLGLLMTALAVLVVLATLGVSATDDGGAEAVRGTSRFLSLVSDNHVLVRTVQSFFVTVRVLALNNAVQQSRLQDALGWRQPWLGRVPKPARVPLEVERLLLAQKA